jgi:hypothetical protein
VSRNGTSGAPLIYMAMRQGDAHTMIRQRAKVTGAATPIGNHSLRATATLVLSPSAIPC